MGKKLEKKVPRLLGAALLFCCAAAWMANAAADSRNTLSIGAQRSNAVWREALARQDQAREAVTFTGTITRMKDTFILTDPANKMVYQLDDTEKARPFEGKK